MIWLKIGIGILAFLVLYVVVAGSLLSRTHVAAARATFARSVPDVWAAITDHAAQVAWRKDLKSIEMQPSQDGKTVFKEVGAAGPVRFIVDESQPQTRYVVRILDENLAFGGRWIFALESAGSGPRLTITEEGEVKNLVFRALSPFFSKTATIKGYLRALGAKLGESVTPEVVKAGAPAP